MEMELAELFKWLGGTAGVIVSLPIARLVLTLARDWGSHTEAIKAACSSVAELKAQLTSADQRNYDASKETSQELRDMATANTSDHGKLFGRMDRSEFILTGDDGANGIRGDVHLAAKKAEAVAVALVKSNKQVEEVARALVQSNKKVEEVAVALVKTNEQTHTMFGKLDTRLGSIEEKVGLHSKSLDRRSVRRKPAGRRKGD